MAEDILCLLNYLQWTEERSLHVVGISLGGMIAQGSSAISSISRLTPILELTYRIPDRVMSLSLIVTSGGGNVWTNMPSVCAHIPCPSTERNNNVFQLGKCLRFARSHFPLTLYLTPV